MVDGPLKGLLARGVIVVDEAGKVVYEELFPRSRTNRIMKQLLLH